MPYENRNTLVSKNSTDPDIHTRSLYLLHTRLSNPPRSLQNIFLSQSVTEHRHSHLTPASPGTQHHPLLHRIVPEPVKIINQKAQTATATRITNMVFIRGKRNQICCKGSNKLQPQGHLLGHLCLSGES